MQMASLTLTDSTSVQWFHSAANGGCLNIEGLKCMVMKNEY